MDRETDAALVGTETSHSAIEATSAVYLARWNHLVSTTNWEKGRIISQWREALIAASAAAAEYSDEAWSQRLQSCTPQHIGRLRRVWERFGDRFTDFDGLYWSHFQAALDWSDAEMWLEGAVQNGWSISTMRTQRSRTLAETGQCSAEEANESDASLDNVSSDVADAMSADVVDVPDDSNDARLRPALGRMDSLDDGPHAAATEDGEDHRDFDPGEAAATATVRPFAELVELPADLADAFEAFKLAILRHKLSGWSQIGRDDVLQALAALEQLALAPSE